uniref:Uncharacterized protein n=1 Tax=Setaria viridis TaxID=4556 RepID=A0A4U6TFZ5_SETVI|nr:hypothetical protein SEVIR_8G063508v2 [Setaria viridis]
MVGSVRSFLDHQGCYWRGALYVCCSDCFVMRISLSDSMYQVIRRWRILSRKINQWDILCIIIPGVPTSDKAEWVLKHDRDIFPILPNLNYDKQCDGPWILTRILLLAT